MAENWNKDDLARMLALEHAFTALALISACNYAHLSETTPSAAVEQFRGAIESSMLDTAEYPKEINQAMQQHLKRMFDHVASMAVHADEGTNAK